MAMALKCIQALLLILSANFFAFLHARGLSMGHASLEDFLRDMRERQMEINARIFRDSKLHSVDGMESAEPDGRLSIPDLAVDRRSANLHDKLLNGILDEEFLEDHMHIAGNVEDPDDGDGNDEETVTLAMPGAAPDHMDAYLCYALKLPEDDRFIVKYEPKAHMQVAHHMLLFGCIEPYETGSIWNCGEMKPVCRRGGQSIMYAWAKNAPDLEMPKGHLVRMEDSRMLKQLFYGALSSGKRAQHKPKKRFKDVIKECLSRLHIAKDAWG